MPRSLDDRGMVHKNQGDQHHTREGNPEMDGKIEFMWKDKDSFKDGCPGLHRAPDGYIVQGRPVTAEERAQLQELGDGDGAVFVPANVLDRLRTEG